ncbi:hypothetical protein B0H19DRAFT_1163643 [Mycena capillaripes]|nr:hypothetical protein B0H19DRAFT_1163643 [Mycena capillaripes]
MNRRIAGPKSDSMTSPAKASASSHTDFTRTTMSTSQDKSWKAREQGEEAAYVHQKEQAQLAALRSDMDAKSQDTTSSTAEAAKSAAAARDRDFEGGFGGQEDLEDRYATTSGEH